MHVDDETDIRAVTALALEALGGYTVESCGSGTQALERLETFTPDLLILDVMMPGMDGPVVLKALRQLPALRELPVIFMTAKVQPQEIDQLLSLGACGVIIKPFDPQTLSSEVEALWQQLAPVSKG
tara:strand:- start:964 stop:1341 length:378 start_codon:yes stop_codon:yes gene_type:complete